MAIIFISGPMKGYPDFNRSAFCEAETKLTEAGHVVLNPAWLPDGMEDAQYIAIDTAMLLQADAIYRLDGWYKSHGASVEWHMAERAGKLIYSQDNLSDNKALGISYYGEESDDENEDREDDTDEDEEESGVSRFAKALYRLAHNSNRVLTKADFGDIIARNMCGGKVDAEEALDDISDLLFAEDYVE